MKKIPLTRGQVALVDDEDYDCLNQFKWMAQWMVATKSFAAARDVVLSDVQRGGDRKSKGFRSNNAGKRPKVKIYMHRLILGTVGKERVDHKDHDTLNNQRDNIRICTASQNGWNRGKQSNNTTGLKGVYKNGDRFIARIRVHPELLNLGTFLTKEEAAKAYDAAAVHLHGEFAKPNFPGRALP